MPISDELKNCGRCKKCARMGEAEYCSRCLVEVIEKRVSKKLNVINSSGKQGIYRILIACDSKESLPCVAAAYLAKKLCKIAAVSVIKQAGLRSKMRQLRTAVVMPECADEAATSLIEGLTGRASRSSGRSIVNSEAVRAVNIFESVTEKELELYATIRRIKYAKGKGSEYSGLKQKIQKLQARYPGTIEALAQASKQMEELRA